MATTQFPAATRTVSGKGTARKLRAAGKIPAVIYGHGRAPQSLELDGHTFTRLLEKVSYLTTVIELTIDGTMARTLIRELQRHPVKRDILHVDFQELVAGEKVTIRVPLKFVGTPEGVRTGGGILDETVRELHISVDPAEIPNHIDVDVAHLQVGKSLHVRDVKAPAGVTILTDAAEPIARVQAPRVESAAASAEGASEA